MLTPGIILQNRYRIIRQLGAGGMGTVYLAHDSRLGNQPVVVKENMGGDPQQFEQEATLLAGLRHFNLPRVFDHFLDVNGLQYLVMDYIEGQNLEQLVRQRGALPESQALAYLNQMLDAVKYLHANRIVHRDIKPPNIIVTAQGNAMLVDFGIAKRMLSGNLTPSAAHGVGSPGYAPLEQYTGGTNERSDIYALGATFYFALTGMEPPPAPDRANGVAMTPLRQCNPMVSANTARVIEQAMAVVSVQRIQTIAEMQAALTTLSPPELFPLVPRRPTQQPLQQKQAVSLQQQKIVSQKNISKKSSQNNYWVRIIMLIIVLALGREIVSNLLKPTPTLVPSVVPPTTAPKISSASPIPPTKEQVSSLASGDGAPIVSVPAGDFTMGSNDGDGEERPAHTVYLDTFWIDKLEVTNALYKKCVDVGKCSRPSETKSHTRNSYYENPSFDNYPVINVSWDDANKYCNWAGKRLPTEAEWEKAARGTDGRNYPWGTKFDSNSLNSEDSGKGDTTVVGSFPSGASPYGAMDMAGNVWEWVMDWYSKTYYANSPNKNPKGPSSGGIHVLRGGSWRSSQDSVRVTKRADQPHGYLIGVSFGSVIGFRCAQ